MKKIFSILLLFILNYYLSDAQKVNVPGTVIDHLPASGKTYIGSPSVCILQNGDYLASHDCFGPASTEHTQALTFIFRSSDKGRSWKKISEINGQFWSGLFIRGNSVYIMGTWKHHGNLIIRRSDDGGVTWTEPVDKKSGLLLEGEYHTAPVPVIFHTGRIWRAVENAKSFTTVWGKRYSAMVVSAPADADLLSSASWLASNSLPYDSTYLDGRFQGWLEGNVVVTHDNKIIDFLRVASSRPGEDLAAMVSISDDGSNASFDQVTGFMNFTGGSKKFSIRLDPKTGKYITIVNLIREEFRNLAAGSVRNSLILQSSTDLKNWTINKILIEHPDVKNHGFQYVDWQFDGRDLIYICRTAFDEGAGEANNYHDANYLTFHRIKNYRKILNK